MSAVTAALKKWSACSRFDESDDEDAIEDNLNVFTESVCIQGDELLLRRVFVRKKGFGAYARVGWVVNVDCNYCMICSVELPSREERLHCYACGNIVCSACSPETGFVAQLPADGAVRVCSLCYWGQDPVQAVQRETPRPVEFLTAFRQSERLSTFGKIGDIAPLYFPAMRPEISGQRILAGSPSSGQESSYQLAPSTSGESEASVIQAPVVAAAAGNEPALVSRLRQVLTSSSESAQLHGMMVHILECIAKLKTMPEYEKCPATMEVYRLAVREVASRCLSAAAAGEAQEPYPAKWILSTLSEPHADSQSAPSNWLPLSWCAHLSRRDGEVSADTLRQVLAENRSTSSKVVDHGVAVSVLSLAVAKRAPDERFVDAVIQEDGSCARIPDSDGAMALMYAAAWNENTEILRTLHGLYPSAISATDAYGFNSLHFACYTGTLAAVAFILENYPEGARIKNKYGVLPLLASALNTRHGGVEMTRLLVGVYSEAVSIPDDEGSMPLHLAAQYGSYELVKYIFDLYPAANDHYNGEGLLPMHFAALRIEKSIEIVNFLTDAHSLSQKKLNEQRRSFTRKGSGSLGSAVFSFLS
jgi:ankyrin repeat protein